ncbi:MAG: OB-fold nucleic acid binding domain-containing protein, partial [Actinomycetota bacterium]|nr:OB-fold nucleic acid binding domain-containing protein [Actinomycetota bacterium]
MTDVPTSGPLTLAELEAIPVERLRGVGQKKKASLAQVDVHTVADLLTYYPRRYIDRTKEARVSDVAPGEEALVLGTVARIDSRRTRNGRTLVTASISDGSGRLSVTFFNQPWRTKQLAEGTVAAFFGKVDLYRGAKQMANPVVDLVGDRTGRIVPIYPQSDKAGLMTWDVASFVTESLRRCSERGLGDPLPADVLAQWGLMSRHQAMTLIHGPESMSDVFGARSRLVFDELLRVQLTLLRRKRALELACVGVQHRIEGELVDRFRSALGFELTAAQQRTMDEIDFDISSATPMHRLLQGDVGSGKTLVAVHAMVVAVQGGHQAALM